MGLCRLGEAARVEPARCLIAERRRAETRRAGREAGAGARRCRDRNRKKAPKARAAMRIQSMAAMPSKAPPKKSAARSPPAARPARGPSQRLPPPAAGAAAPGRWVWLDAAAGGWACWGMVVCFPRLAPPPMRLASASGRVMKETLIRANKKARKVFNVDSSSVASTGRTGGAARGCGPRWVPRARQYVGIWAWRNKRCPGAKDGPACHCSRKTSPRRRVPDRPAHRAWGPGALDSCRARPGLRARSPVGRGRTFATAKYRLPRGSDSGPICRRQRTAFTGS